MARSAEPGVVTVNELLDGQVVLDIECLDRIYLSGFVNSLQTPGGVIYFLHHHRGMPIASPAVFARIGDQFRRGGVLRAGEPPPGGQAQGCGPQR
jgi:hypothetical protein